MFRYVWALVWAVLVWVLGPSLLFAEATKRIVLPTEPGTSALADKEVLTKKELDKLPFPPQPNGGRAPFQIGVWMSKTRYEQGEPVRALFVLKNYGKTQGVDFYAVFPGSGGTAYNNGAVHIRAVKLDLPKGTPVPNFLSAHTWVCGIGSLSQVEAKSYWCFRRDLAKSGLVPGTYVAWWSYGKKNSEKVTFRVLRKQAKQMVTPQFVRPLEYHFWLELQGRGVCSKIDANNAAHQIYPWGGWRSRGWLSVASDLAAGHKTGEKTQWYLNPHDLPTSDEVLKVSGKWITSKGRKKQPPTIFEVQLNSVAKGKKVNFDNVRWHPVLVVIPTKGAKLLKDIERWAKVRRNFELPEDQKDSAQDVNFGKKRTGSRWNVRIVLPKDWTKRLPFHGPAVCAVVLTSHRIRPRAGNRVMLREMRKSVLLEQTEVITRWEGLLRTPWVKIDVPQ